MVKEIDVNDSLLSKSEIRIGSDDPVLILGMHRSGTSALAGCLSLLGINFGSAFMPGDGSNAAGYYENQEILAVHEILLRDLRCRWNMIGELPEGWSESAAATTASTSLARIFERQFLGRGPWAVKDPRLSRLMPVWFRALASVGVEPRFVHVLRHPLEVAKSLETRDGIPLLEGHLLWLVHHWSALQATADFRHALLTYDELLQSPVAAMQSIATALDLHFPREPADHARDLAGFACPDLKHQRAGEPRDDDSSRSFAEFTWIYDSLRTNRPQALRPGRGGGNGLGRREGPGGFPLPLLQGGSLEGGPDRNPVVDLLRRMLALVGELERKELDAAVQRERRIMAASGAEELLYAQVMFPAPASGPAPFEQTTTKLLIADDWQLIEVGIPRAADLRNQRLRIDPLNTRGVVSIASIGLFRVTDDQGVWVANGASELAQCMVAGDAFVLPGTDALEIVCTDGDPQVLLPMFPELPDVPLCLRVWLKPSRSQRSFESRWGQLQTAAEELRNRSTQSEHQLAEHRQEIDGLRAAVAASHAEAAEHRREIGEVRVALAASHGEAAKLARRLAQQEATAREQSAAGVRLRAELAEARGSLAWAQSLIARLDEEKRLLVEWFQDLHRSFEGILGTRRWRVGNALGASLAALRLRSETPTAVTVARRVFADFTVWWTGSPPLQSTPHDLVAPGADPSPAAERTGHATNG